jgi:hypothetical protein
MNPAPRAAERVMRANVVDGRDAAFLRPPTLREGGAVGSGRSIHRDRSRWVQVETRAVTRLGGRGFILS